MDFSTRLNGEIQGQIYLTSPSAPQQETGANFAVMLRIWERPEVKVEAWLFRMTFFVVSF
jgi:hypothetical protein